MGRVAAPVLGSHTRPKAMVEIYLLSVVYLGLANDMETRWQIPRHSQDDDDRAMHGVEERFQFVRA